MLASLIKAVVPTRYVLSKDGVRTEFMGSSVFISWERIRRIQVSQRGILLSPMKKASVLDSIRSVFLYTPDERTKQRALELIGEFAKRAEYVKEGEQAKGEASR